MSDRNEKAWKDEVRNYRDKLEVSENSWTPAKYKEFLDNRWQRYVEDPDHETMQLATRQTLENNKVFERWTAYKGSSALIITAVNHPNAELREELWLSPALAEFAGSIQADDKCKVIFHVLEEGKHSLWDVLPVILCDILGSDYELFKEHKRSLSNSFSGFNPQSGRENWFHGENGHLANPVKELLTAWVAKYPDRTLFVIVDKLDRCLPRGSTEEKDALRRALKFFVTLTWDSRGKLKFLFLAVHNAHWPKWDFGDLNDTRDPNRLLWYLEWRQGECI